MNDENEFKNYDLPIEQVLETYFDKESIII